MKTIISSIQFIHAYLNTRIQGKHTQWARRCLIVMSLVVGAANAQTKPASAVEAAPPPQPIRAVKLLPEERITLDGTLNDAAWKRAPVFSGFYEVDPVRGRKPEYETKVQVMYDASALYVGITALDPKPDLVRINLVRHDKVFRTQDFVAVYIDSIGSKKAAQYFRVNAAGSTSDGLHTAENDNEDFSPDFDYDAASVRNENGYTAVMRIPYSSLRYSAQATGQWRIMVARRVPRDNFYLLLSAYLPRQSLSFIDVLQPLEGFEPPQNSAFLQLRPTITARRTVDKPAGVKATIESDIKASLDIKWRPRPELVVDATINPDFSQVELDVPQLSRNTRFALFLNEKRPFFLESADLLNSPTSALYTRSVNDPKLGLRASWRSDDIAGTAMVIQDRGGGLTLLPGAYGTGVALQGANTTFLSRVRTDQGALSYGVIGISRSYDAGGQNNVIGGDLNWNLNDSTRIKAQLLGSNTNAQPNTQGGLSRAASVSGTRLYLEANYRAENGGARLSYEDVSGGYRNDAGFLSQNNIRSIDGNFQRNWFGLGPFNRFEATVNYGATQDRSSSRVINAYISPGVGFEAANNTEVYFQARTYSRQRNEYGGPFLAEKYLNYYGQTSPGTKLTLVQSQLDVGMINDVVADRIRHGVRGFLSASMRLLPQLEFEPRWDQSVFFANGQRVSNEAALRILSIWHLAPRQTIRLILQRSSYERKAESLLGIAADSARSGAQSLTYTWRKSAGTVLYVGASRGVVGLNPQRNQSTEVFVKLQFDTDDVKRWTAK